MSESDWSTLEPWANASERDEEGRVAFCFGLAATFYFQNGHTEERRRAVLECFNEYDRMCGRALRWWVVEDGRFGSVAKLTDRDMSRYLLSPEFDKSIANDRAWGFLWHGGEHADDASPFFIHGFGSPKVAAEKKNYLSFLHMGFPIAWFCEKDDNFPDLVARWARSLQPVHGYGGVTLIQSPEDGLAQMFGAEVSGFANRHPGIEIDIPMSHKFFTQHAIKGGNWVTVLSSYFANRIGGPTELRAKLGERFRILEYPGGLVLVAGPLPEVGDRNRKLDTPLYRELARILKPIRVTEHVSMHDEGPLAEDGAFEAWLARFDS